MAEDIRDALIDYQVGGGSANAITVELKFGDFDRHPSNGLYITRIVN